MRSGGAEQMRAHEASSFGRTNPNGLCGEWRREQPKPGPLLHERQGKTLVRNQRGFLIFPVIGQRFLGFSFGFSRTWRWPPCILPVFYKPRVVECTLALRQHCHCEEQSDEQSRGHAQRLDCFAALAMTRRVSPAVTNVIPHDLRLRHPQRAPAQVVLHCAKMRLSAHSRHFVARATRPAKSPVHSARWDCWHGRGTIFVGRFICRFAAPNPARHVDRGFTPNPRLRRCERKSCIRSEAPR